MSEKEKRTQKDSAKSESTNQQEFQNMQAPSENQTKDCVTLEESRLTWCFSIKLYAQPNVVWSSSA